MSTEESDSPTPDARGARTGEGLGTERETMLERERARESEREKTSRRGALPLSAQTHSCQGTARTSPTACTPTCAHSTTRPHPTAPSSGSPEASLSLPAPPRALAEALSHSAAGCILDLNLDLDLSRSPRLSRSLCSWLTCTVYYKLLPRYHYTYSTSAECVPGGCLAGASIRASSPRHSSIGREPSIIPVPGCEHGEIHVPSTTRVRYRTYGGVPAPVLARSIELIVVVRIVRCTAVACAVCTRRWAAS